jgi:hypothetical protein
VVDAACRAISPNLIIALLTEYLIRRRHTPGGIGRTVATTRLVDRVARAANREMVETPVKEGAVPNAVTGQIDLKQEVVMYLQPHLDPVSKKSWPAGTRAVFQTAGELPRYMKADVGELYQMLEDLKEKARAMMPEAHSN